MEIFIKMDTLLCVLLTINSNVLKVVIVGKIQIAKGPSEMLVWAGEREVGGGC